MLVGIVAMILSVNLHSRVSESQSNANFHHAEARLTSQQQARTIIGTLLTGSVTERSTSVSRISSLMQEDAARVESIRGKRRSTEDLCYAGSVNDCSHVARCEIERGRRWLFRLDRDSVYSQTTRQGIVDSTLTDDCFTNAASYMRWRTASALGCLLGDGEACIKYAASLEHLGQIAESRGVLMISQACNRPTFLGECVEAMIASFEGGILQRANNREFDVWLELEDHRFLPPRAFRFQGDEASAARLGQFACDQFGAPMSCFHYHRDFAADNKYLEVAEEKWRAAEARAARFDRTRRQDADDYRTTWIAMAEAAYESRKSALEKVGSFLSGALQTVAPALEAANAEMQRQALAMATAQREAYARALAADAKPSAPSSSGNWCDQVNARLKKNPGSAMVAC